MNKFIFYIKNNINFAFGHFNDGEISLILGEAPRKGISRGKQKCSSSRARASGDQEAAE